jgi:hypothetical protein
LAKIHSRKNEKERRRKGERKRKREKHMFFEKKEKEVGDFLFFLKLYK